MATINATTPALADVLSALSGAGSGDVVVVPTGSATWGTAFNIPAGVTLEGDASGTVITTTVSAESGTIGLSSSATVKNFTISGGASPPFGITTGAQGWRITGITYSSSAGNSFFLQLSTTGATYGLIDNCDITGPGGSSELIYTRGASDAWDNPATYGTDQAIYIEDCTFNGQGYVSDFNSNAKGVVRFCTINGGIKVDLHGVASNTPARSGRHMEVYNNAWSAAGVYTSIEHRGGGMMCFNNTNSATASNIYGTIRLHEYALNSIQWPNFSTNQTLNDYPIRDQVGRGRYTTPGDWTTAESEPCYLWGNRRGATQWRLDWTNPASTTRVTNSSTYSVGATSITFTGTAKIGAGTAFKFTGDTTWYVVTSGREIGSSAAVTISPPLSIGFTGPATVSVGSIENYRYQQGDDLATFTTQQVIAADRDYFNEIASFNGTSGVGISTRAQMDAITPTLPGVGFWVTDEGNWNATAAADESGQLYTWNGSAWVLKYVPYTYPHPLRGALAAPTFSLQPVDTTTEEGSPTVFSCTASANPSPTYQWRKGGVAISGATSATYTIAITQLSDAGAYDCVATNSQDSTTSNSATLTVDAITPGTPPAFTVQPASLSVNEADDASFTAEATGDPTPTLQWRKGGSNLSESARIIGVTTGSLSILDVTESDEGAYDCVATSTAGSATSTGATLIVNQTGYQPSTPSVIGNRGTRARRLGIF